MAKTPVMVSYTGIIGFVPIPRTSSYTVVVPYAGKGDHEHLPYIVLPDNAGIPPDTLEYAVFKNDNGSNVPPYFKAYLLEGWDISFDNNITSNALNTRWAFHGHVLPLAEGCQPASQGQDRIKGSYLRSRDKDLIAPARLELIRGILEGRVHEVAYDSKYYEWTFENLGAPWRALAQVVSHLFEIGEDGAGYPALYIRFTGASQTFTVKVPPKYKDGKPYILLRIANTLKDLGYDTWKPYDDHVKLYYDLASVTYPPANRHQLISREVERLPVLPRETLIRDEPQFKQVLEADDWSPKVNGANCPPGGWTG